MVIDINKIIVKSDRIRQDMGNIKELADDIKQNGLINPPVVNKNYELLTGERRLKACKSLGWSQIEVRVMDTRDAEHELNVEISENENRKEFSKSERVDYMKRLLRIEQAKAKENMSAGGEGREISRNLRSDESTASQFGISSNTMRKEISIVDNKDLLTPEDFADWDEGKLSTNKAFQKVKAELAARDKEIEKLKKKRTTSWREKSEKARADRLQSEKEELETKISELESELDNSIVDDEETQNLIADYETKIKEFEAEISRLKKTQYSPQGQELNAAYDFSQAAGEFITKYIAPIRYNDIVKKYRDEEAGKTILKTCIMLSDAVNDVIKRFNVEEDIIDAEV